MVPTGFAEAVLARCPEVDDPAVLWDTATTCAALAQKWNGHGAEKAEIKAAQMYVEIELGQRLGPNPGAGGDHKSEDYRSNSHDDLIPAYVVSDVRRLYGHSDDLVAAVREGARSRRSLLLLVDQLEAAERAPVESADLDVRLGDFREALDIEPGSASLILTDPPYPAAYLPLWSELGKHAAIWLEPGGSLVAYSGQSHLPEVLDRLGEHLRYWWTIALLHRNSDMIPGKWVSAGWKPLVWYVRDSRRGQFMVPDRINGTEPRKTIPVGDGDDWAQGVGELEPIISALTAPGDLIVDPFAGSGSVGIAALRFGRRFIGAELD